MLRRRTRSSRILFRPRLEAREGRRVWRIDANDRAACFDFCDQKALAPFHRGGLDREVVSHVPRPDSRYGLTKVFGEQMGFLYAHKFAVRSFSMRIGMFLPEPTNLRSLSTWLSHPDMVALAKVGLTADYICEIDHGMSNNARGIRGAAIDGGIRDTRQILDKDFPVFYKYRSPNGALSRSLITHYQIPIKIGTTLINPGDVVIGDIDGVMVIPRRIAVEVLERAEEILRNEKKIFGWVAEGQSLNEITDEGGYF